MDFWNNHHPLPHIPNIQGLEIEGLEPVDPKVLQAYEESWNTGFKKWLDKRNKRGGNTCKHGTSQAMTAPSLQKQVRP